MSLTCNENELLTAAASELDCVGLYCPEPLFRTRMEMDRLRPGDVLEVFADDPAAESDLRSYAKRAGHEVLCAEWKDGTLRLLIKKDAKTAK